MKILKKSAIIFGLIFFLFNITLAALGVSSVLLTLVFYFLLGAIGVWLMQFFFRHSEKRYNWIISTSTLFICLLLADLFIRYGLKRHLSYSERNGEFFWLSPYVRYNLLNFVNNRLMGKTIYQQIVQNPGTVDEYNGQEFFYTHHYNALGLRGSLPDSSEKKILIGLGDSFTEGLGAPEDSTWVALTAHLLGCTYINAGIIGSDPVQEYIVLQELLKTYRPQRVILAINSSDVNDIMMLGGISRYDAAGNTFSRPAPWWDMLYGGSFIVRSVVHDVLHFNFLLMSHEQWERESIAAEDTIVNLVQHLYLPLARHYGFEFSVAVIPALYDFWEKKFSLERLTTKLESVPGLRVINLYDCYSKFMEQNAANTETLYWAIDLHLTPKGYALMAKCIADNLSGSLPN
jgi:lysophospholipase L1-like esterase/uncharacterized membrane protein YuzA (DUF378 family)